MLHARLVAGTEHALRAGLRRAKEPKRIADLPGERVGDRVEILGNIEARLAQPKQVRHARIGKPRMAGGEVPLWPPVGFGVEGEGRDKHCGEVPQIARRPPCPRLQALASSGHRSRMETDHEKHTYGNLSG